MRKCAISDPLVREAIYFGYHGRCFYTGRPVPKEMMEIDHLVPIAKGGMDAIENYVLTCKKTNLTKRDKMEPSMIERMQYIVKIAFAPRVMRKLEELRRKNKRIFRGKRPKGLVCVGWKDLFWCGDRGIKILTNSTLVTTENIYEIRKAIDKYTEIAREHSITFCDDAWLTKDFVKQIKSLWYEIDNRLIKIVEKAILYGKKPLAKWGDWGTIYFNSEYIAFLEEMDKVYAEDEEVDYDNEAEYDEYMKTIYEKFQPPEHLRKKWEDEIKM